jgi:hypothetical protein
MASERNRETALWNWLKTHLNELRAVGLKHDVQRIENAIGKGTPDVEGCIAGETFWCELKVAYEMANNMLRVRITADQVRRALRREKAGGRSWVLVRVCGRTWRENRHFLISGQDAEELLNPLSRDRMLELSQVDPTAAAVEVLKALVGRP